MKTGYTKYAPKHAILAIAELQYAATQVRDSPYILGICSSFAFPYTRTSQLLRDDISYAMGERGYSTYVSAWLKMHHNIHATGEELRTYRLAWIQSMIVNLQTNGTIHANP